MLLQLVTDPLLPQPNLWLTLGDAQPFLDRLSEEIIGDGIILLLINELSELLKSSWMRFLAF